MSSVYHVHGPPSALSYTCTERDLNKLGRCVAASQSLEHFIQLMPCPKSAYRCLSGLSSSVKTKPAMTSSSSSFFFLLLLAEYMTFNPRPPSSSWRQGVPPAASPTRATISKGASGALGALPRSPGPFSPLTNQESGWRLCQRHRPASGPSGPYPDPSLTPHHDAFSLANTE